MHLLISQSITLEHPYLSTSNSLKFHGDVDIFQSTFTFNAYQNFHLQIKTSYYFVKAYNSHISKLENLINYLQFLTNQNEKIQQKKHKIKPNVTYDKAILQGKPM